MKFIRFTMSKGEPFVLSEEQAEKVFSSAQQLVLISEKGKWSGQMINKAHIVCTDRDIEAEEQYRSRNNVRLQAPKGKPVDPIVWDTFKKDMTKKVNKLK